MPRSLFSPSWHSVADLKPRLAAQARIERHVYRGQVWYVVQDQSGGRYHRLTPAACALVRGMDGERTVQALWEEANAAGAGDACTQTEIVDLLVQLHGADLLRADATPDSSALFERYRQKRRATWKQYLLNPMSLKVPLVDPHAFVDRWTPALAWCFGRAGVLLWLAAVLPAAILAGQHWNELTHNLSEQVLSSSNLWVMALVFPAVKLAHELGHAFAVHAWGGSVREMGVMFLVFAPVPYVNASAASAFPSKWRRAAVAAAGMLTELFIAALSLYVWLLAEPGVARAVAYNAMVVAGVSTLIVNGNPLLRYDGYYILCDLIEMPNLAQRGQKYLTYLWDRYVFGAREADAPRESPAEKRWLFCYTPLAWCYRVFVTLSIILFVSGQFFIFGVLIGLWGLATLLLAPLWKAWRHVTHSPGLRRHRAYAVRLTLALAAITLTLAFAVPMPLHTRAEGVVWLPDQAIVRAGGDGFFARWRVEPGSRVGKGEALFEQEDRQLAARIEVARAKADEARARFLAEAFADPVKARVSERQLLQEQAMLDELLEQAALLTGRAESDGVLAAARAQDLPGRHLKKGELIGYVLARQSLVARAVVTQDDIDLVRNRFRGAELRLADSIGRAAPVSLLRPPAGGVDELPTPALGLSGGGVIPTLPGDPNGVKTVERVFLVDMALPGDWPPAAFGERVYVRFDHGPEPLAWQGLRRLRQLFLGRFGV
ncbi:MAG: efflux RND transporter periplasmic adaptor subunit [Candidatus Accumulibacter sp.]|jgi:putative peptide zinc metalloprotease protein|nr:efflux RND transporter periplasmic adaptor subunit [Accumulibacter sp.]